MTQLRPFTVSALAAAAAAPLMAAAMVLAPAHPVQAQQQPQPPAIEWTPRRLDQLDRNVRRLERAVTQRNAAGAPVIIETDPEVVILQGVVSDMQRRLADLEATVQRMNGDNERLTFAVDEAQRDNAAMRRLLTDSNNRITELEGQLQAVSEANAPIVADSPTGDARQDFDRAIRMANSNDVRARRALEVFVITWPDAAQAREANYRLGDLRTGDGDQAGAVQAYAAALSGWPRTSWAPEATIKLATGLNATERNTQACAAVREFFQRYGEGAPTTLINRARQIRERAECPA
ncbi:MAG: tol-pal system protein [Brevundimonas sp.]|uniref:tol-pal system protein n=1 Tax=Brevundimonas sp. TaxID=1871086 RepID=UPI0039194B13